LVDVPLSYMDGALLLAGKEVAFSGRLAALSRAEAAALVIARDGRCVRAVTGQTAILVVGQQCLRRRKSTRIAQSQGANEDVCAIMKRLVAQTHEESEE
jgi:NAD-dependent DNA ligase